MKRRFNEKSVAALALPPGKAQLVVWDTEVTGFGLVIGKETRTFIAEDRIDGVKVRRKVGTLGRVRDDGLPWSVQLARERAKELLGGMAGGMAPNGLRTRAGGPTLREALDFHVSKMERGENRRGKVCSPRSIATLRGCVELHLADYLGRPLLGLTADVLDDIRMAIEREAERMGGSNPANPPGRATSNRILANVSAIWRSWHRRHGLPASNPTERLIAGALKPRNNRIANSALPAWHAKVLAMKNHVRRDLQLVALFTGVRTDGVRNLRWDDINFDEDQLHVARAKGDRPYTLPLVGTVRAILEARRKENAKKFKEDGGDRGFVFPTWARDGKKVIATAEAKERCNVLDARGNPKRTEDGDYVRETYLPGIQATRKTFNSVAIEIGVPLEAREALMNHEGHGVNVKSYGFPQNWDYLAEQAALIEAALWKRLKADPKAKRAKLRAV